MKRRQFITLLGGAAAWPMASHAQQAERMRRVGVLMLYVENDPEGQVRANAFRHALEATADGTPLGLPLGGVPLVQKLAIKSVKLQFLISVVEPSGGAITVRLTPIR